MEDMDTGTQTRSVSSRRTLYLKHIGDHLQSRAAVKEAANSLSWAHGLAGLESPTHHPLVQTTLEGLKRKLAKPVTKKALMTVEILTEIVEDMKKYPTLSNIPLAAACLLAMLGSSELIS